jgi:probable phosphoglycerate mutase
VIISKSTRVILVRHGQTEWNDGSRFQGHLDSPLTQAGKLQAESIGRRIAEEEITAIHSSDLGRARHTAELIAAPANLPVQVDSRLRERSLGVFEGLSRDDIAARYPEETRRYYSRDPHYAVPGGQSTVEHFQIGLACLNEIAARHQGESIVAVTHGGLVQAMFRQVTGIGFEAPRRFAIRNAAYNVFLRDEGGWSLETWGDISHYPAEIMTAGSFHVENYTPEVQ